MRREQMKLRSALLAATVLALPFAASAQPVTGLYLGAGLGVNFTQQESVKSLSFSNLGPLTGTNTLSTNLKSSVGFVGVMSAGWGFGNGLRAEVEGNYRNNHISGFTGGGSGGVGGGTTEQKYGAMVNVLYDFNGVAPWIVPYVGAGAGYVWVNERYHAYNTLTIGSGATATAPGALGITGNNTKGSFAYQAILGAAFPLPQVTPGLAATLEYRFLGTAGNRGYSGVATRGTAAVPANLTLG